MNRVPRITARGRARALDVANLGAHWVTHRKGGYAGKPFLLDEWQWRDIILPAYGRLRPDGRRWYDRVLVLIPRWNGKTELGSLMVDNSLFLEPVHEGESYMVATSLKQAGIGFRTVKSGIVANRELRSMVEVSKHEVVVKETQAVFRCLPHDADTAQGFHPNFVLLDELHVHRNRGMLDAMLSGMIGFDEPLLVAISTVGVAQDGVWWDVFNEWREDPHALVVFYGAGPRDDPRDPKTWRKANPASWVTDEMLAAAYDRLPFGSFCRYHLNLPASGLSENRAFDLTRWKRCSARPTIDEDRPCIIGVDASLSRDETAVVLEQRDTSEGTHSVMAWFFEGEAVGDERPFVDQERVRELIMALCHSHKVARVVCDPAYFRESMELLDEAGIPVESFKQDSAHMAPASQALFDAIAQGKLRHGGDQHLTEHVLTAIATDTAWGWRIDKPSKKAHIDGAIALALAVYASEAESTGSASSAFVMTG